MADPENVKLEDRIMARKGDITTDVQPDNGRLYIDIDGLDHIRIDVNELSEEIRMQAMLHGLKQKIVDAAALGQGATLQEKFDAMYDVAARLRIGEWNKARGDGEPRGGLLLEALIRLYPAKTRETLKEWLTKQDKKAQAKLRSTPKVAKAIDAIRVERAGFVDADDLLAELED